MSKQARSAHHRSPRGVRRRAGEHRRGVPGRRLQGADWVELDVRLIADGALIVHHDQWYRDQRTVYSVAADDRPAGVPLLGEALDGCAGMGINIEIKNSPGDLADAPHDLSVVARVLELLAARRDRGLIEEILISSFDPPTLDRVRELDPAMPTGLLVIDPGAPDDAVERAMTAGHVALHPWYPCVDALLMDRCDGRACGSTPGRWTTPRRSGRWSVWASDGIVTNTPALARRALGQRPGSGVR